jgi:large subunit ribosomal protein L15
MTIHISNFVAGKSKGRKRVGRGSSAGGGTTAGRGTKGQKARTGGKVPHYFEGGQTPLIRRVKKRKGFTSRNNRDTFVINLINLPRFVKDGKLEVSSLVAAGKIKPETRVKILSVGEIKEAVAVSAHAVSTSARNKIEAAGGSVTIVR